MTSPPLSTRVGVGLLKHHRLDDTPSWGELHARWGPKDVLPNQPQTNHTPFPRCMQARGTTLTRAEHEIEVCRGPYGVVVGGSCHHGGLNQAGSARTEFELGEMQMPHPL